MHAITPNVSVLVPECITTSEGIGPVVDCHCQRGELLVVTLAIDTVLQQQSLAVAIWGSPDSARWGTKPLARFPEKSYCGLYSVLLNLADHADVQYLRAHWTVRRWDKKSREPMFGFHVYAEPSGARLGGRPVRLETHAYAQALVRAAS